MDSIDLTTLTPIVRDALQDESADITNWSRQPIEGGLSGATVHRFQGQAQTAKALKPWSIILKIISKASASQAVTDGEFWQREKLLYQSDLLTGLPQDLIVPSCYHIAQQSNNEYWLWLEDMGAESDEEWPLKQYTIVARHLGQMNGAYLVGRPLPNHDWLSQPDTRQRLVASESGIIELPKLSHTPYFAELLGDNRAERIMSLWPERGRLLAGVEQLPQTFCHGDAFRRNLMVRHSANGRPQTVIMDWEAAGLQFLGGELVSLFAATLAFVAIDIDRIAELDGLIFSGYVAGLRDAGWEGDERMVRFGFTALSALQVGIAEPATKMPNIARRIAALPPGVEPPQLLNPGGPKQAVAVGNHILNMGEEALGLLRDVT